ncbi:MAG: Gfo/Idh/MocA family oxidoreductase [Pseudomonadota bacterium]
MITLGVIGIDHRHIYTMLSNTLAAGARLKGWATDGTPGTLDGFVKRFPDAPRVVDAATLIDDPEIDLILTAAVPSERPAIAIRAMEAGKDVMTDKPGALTFGDLDRLRATQAATGRIWSVDFSERFEVPSVALASELVAGGTIGRVIQTLGIGPHRLNAATRPDWFWDRARNGGILADIGSHQIDQFLHFTGATEARIAHAAAVCHRAEPFQDFGEIVLRSDDAHGYIRLDWYTPDGLPTWGDGRLFLLGTEGTIEIRKYVDAPDPATDTVILTTHAGTERIDGREAGLPYFPRFLADLRDRTETAMAQSHAFRVTELAIEAQRIAETC